jgi:hypothetical protein
MKLDLQEHGITNGIAVSPPGQKTIAATIGSIMGSPIKHDLKEIPSDGQ